MAKKRGAAKAPKIAQTETYQHKEAESLLRPEVGTQAQFRKKKEPKQYKYDSSLAPELNWDGQNPAREQGEELINQIIEAKSLEEAKAAAQQLRSLSKPFLNWAGKAERLSFDVPTLPLFIHERLSTKAIIETLKTHKRDKQIELDLFGDTKYSIADQVLKAYEYQDKWTNRMILGDSLVVMNSLLHYEGMGGQVQMIYMDPPYGVKFGSNFQPFVRKRDVKHNEDDDMTREPEMVKAYRDTWELGLHSYLTYLRDRLLLSRELLSATGSVFVQISDENVHHVRELMDEVFGAENFMSLISFRTKIPLGTKYLAGVADYILWYAKSAGKVKFRRYFVNREVGADTQFTWIEDSDGSRRRMTKEEREGLQPLPSGSRTFRLSDLVSTGRTESCVFEFEFEGRKFFPSGGKSWKTNPDGIAKLIKANRIVASGSMPAYIFYQSDYPVQEIGNLWTDTQGASDKYYVVQTADKVIQRCMLMTTDPGDLVLDPTCGSGTSSYVAEQWGRRWITIDTSRVPLALARQRLLTATFPYYKLKEEQRGPVGGFVYERRQNSQGEEVGGIVPHITLGSITNEEPGGEEILVDKPEEVTKITRVTGPFVFEATIPTPMEWIASGEEALDHESYGSFVHRMIEVLRKSPMLHLDGGKTIQFKNVRPPAKSLSLSAEAVVDATAVGQKPSLKDAIAESDEKNKGMLPLSQKHVALVFGPENGAVSEKLVFEAAKEASAKNYTHLYVIGFAIQANARQLVDNCEQVAGIGATYVQATPDLMMGDLLKNMRSSQIFSVCGLPEIRIRKVKAKGEPDKYQVELLGLDVFDPVSMEVEHRKGDDVPAWFLDTDYNEMVFHVTQAFFPRTSAWSNLKKALKASYEETVWDHLAGSTSAPFLPGDHEQVSVKVIDDRGNELMVIKKLSEAEE